MEGKPIICIFCKNPNIKLPLLKTPDGRYYHQDCVELRSALDVSTGLILAKPISIPARKQKVLKGGGNHAG